MGSVVEAPAGQVDLVPTILRLKGIEGPASLDGRVLLEALREDPADGGAPSVETRTLTARTPDGRYEATVQISVIDGHRYLDEGRRTT